MSRFFASRWRVAATTLLALATFAGCAGLDTQQRRWIFQASAIEGEPGARHDDFADVWIDHRPTGDTSAVRLHGLWLDGPSATSPVLLYLHGSRRNVEASVWRI